MLQGSEAIAADPIFANAAEKVIPAPEVYSDWFTQVDDQRRKLAVGARRFAVVQDRVGGTPSWSAFVDPGTGRLLTTEELQQEQPMDRARRMSQVDALIAERRRATREVATFGFQSELPVQQPPERPAPEPIKPKWDGHIDQDSVQRLGAVVAIATITEAEMVRKAKTIADTVYLAQGAHTDEASGETATVWRWEAGDGTGDWTLDRAQALADGRRHAEVQSKPPPVWDGTIDPLRIGPPLGREEIATWNFYRADGKLFPQTIYVVRADYQPFADSSQSVPIYQWQSHDETGIQAKGAWTASEEEAKRDGTAHAKDNNEEPPEWDGEIDEDRIKAGGESALASFLRYPDGEEVKETVWLEIGSYRPFESGTQVVEVYRWRWEEEEGEWTTSRGDAEAEGKEYAEGANEEPPEMEEWDGEIDESEVEEDSRRTIATFSTWNTDDEEDGPVEQEYEVDLVYGTYDPFPDREDSEKVDVYKWQFNDDGTVIAEGEWTTDKAAATAEGKAYAADEDEEEPDTPDKEEEEDSEEKQAKRAKAKEKAEQIFGSVPDSAITSTLGAPEGAKVKTKPLGKWKGHYIDDVRLDAHGFEVEIEHPKLKSMRRFIGVDVEGNKFIKNDLLEVKKAHQGEGLGSTIFADQVKNAQAQGYAYIQTHAAGDAKPGQMNGYYTWPRVGYDESLDSIRKNNPKLAKKIAAEYPDAKSALDVFAEPGGPDWWKENGSDLYDARFDLTPGSRSMKVMEAYMEERKKRPPKPVKESLKEAKRSGRFRGTDLELSAEEEAALDAAWKRLHAEGTLKRP